MENKSAKKWHNYFTVESTPSPTLSVSRGSVETIVPYSPATNTTEQAGIGLKRDKRSAPFPSGMLFTSNFSRHHLLNFFFSVQQESLIAWPNKMWFHGNRI